jgi:hypothetical protein
MLLLVAFLYRLSFGMAAAMAVTSPRLVTSGYYRNNCYVLLGMNLLTALVSWSGMARGTLPGPWPAVAAAVVSYLAAVVWLYEKPRAGVAALAILTGLTFIGALLATPVVGKPPAAAWLAWADSAVAGLVLGVTMAAMLLGHWYLNAPGMKISPLIRLTAFMAAVVAARVVVSGLGLAGHLGALAPLGSFASAEAASPDFVEGLMIALRWISGVLGTALLIIMTRSTLRIPNTQAATGMLYVAVITTFLGELVGQLLSAKTVYPL